MTVVVRELTPSGAGAVSVLLVAGPRAREVLAAVSTRALPGVGEITWTRLAVHGVVLDEALICARSDQELELHVHGAPLVVRALIEHMAVLGARGPAPSVHGESIEARARARAVTASCESGARMLLDQAEGALRRALTEIAHAPADARERAIELLERARVARALFQPTRVVIAGPVNAGKSTLFNALVGTRRAIVSDEPGTTRDVVTEEVLFGAYPVVLADTAGDRTITTAACADDLERAGRARGVRARAAADLVLWLSPVDATHPTVAVDATPPTVASNRAPRILVVRSCADRAPRDARQGDHATPWIAARDEPAAARELVQSAFRRAFALPSDPWRPGAAVPFEDEQVRVLDALVSHGANAAISARLRECLERSASE